MKATELREMTDVELAKQLKDLKAELFNLRFQHAINQLENPPIDLLSSKGLLHHRNLHLPYH